MTKLTIICLLMICCLVAPGRAFSNNPTRLQLRNKIWNRPLSLKMSSLKMSSNSYNSKDHISFLKDAILPIAVSAVLWLSPITLSAGSQDFIIHPQSVNAIEIVSTTSPQKAILTLDTPRDRPIMDLSHVLSNVDKSKILEAIEHAEEKTGSEIQVVICDQIPLGITPKKMATTLFNEWHIGPSTENNGVLILTVLDQRRAEIELGDGIPKSVIDAEWCTKTLEKTAIPYFLEEEYGTGIYKTIDKIGKRLEGNNSGGVDPIDQLISCGVIGYLLCIIYQIFRGSGGGGGGGGGGYSSGGGGGYSSGGGGGASW